MGEVAASAVPGVEGACVGFALFFLFGLERLTDVCNFFGLGDAGFA